jgi:hypothetical protein
MNVVPADALTGAQITTTSDGLTGLVNGIYASFTATASSMSHSYIRQFYQMSDFASDDIVCAYKSEDDLTNSFRYNDRTSEKSNINYFWEISYKIVYGSNVAISMADKKGTDALTNQLKGESYFLRAYATHNLVRFFAKPYSETNKTEPGVIIRTDYTDNKIKARATLEETYNYITSSLKMAETLMSDTELADRVNSNHRFANKKAVWALLSRVYLYKGNLDSCILYSNKIIDSGLSLETAEEYPTYFPNAKTGSETIWLIAFNSIDDMGEGSVASMIFNGLNCWGEEGATPSLMKGMSVGIDGVDTVDQRWKYIITKNPPVKNGINMYYITKFSWQDGSPTLISPVFLRLAEAYLNRAEAYAKKGDVTSAVADLNSLLLNRLVVPAGMDFTDYAYKNTISTANIVDVVLNERRIELAFEGHRIFDLLRNGKDIIRNYWGYHLDTYNGVPGDGDPGLSTGGVFSLASNPRLIYPIPSGEISTNSLCVPNN